MTIPVIRLGVNIDHVATIREARGVDYPDVNQAALIAIKAGADGITLHLREDRRHIQDADVFAFKETLNVPMNLEIAVTDEMIGIAKQVRPTCVCFVPEKREELTTEGGLDVLSQLIKVKSACEQLMLSNITASLFIDPELVQIDAAKKTGASTIELHTGAYADAKTHAEQMVELERIQKAAAYAYRQGLVVNAGHGLTLENVASIAAIPEINELNIGHAIVSHALFVGLAQAVKDMKALMLKARQLFAVEACV